MDLNKRIDPELAPSLDMMPATAAFELEKIPEIRVMSETMFAQMMSALPPVSGVEVTDYSVPGPEGAPDVQVRVYHPENMSNPAGGLLWIHGGGFIMGNYELDDHNVRQMCVATGCVYVSVSYRLAPENPFPDPVEDCYAALKWMVNNNDMLRIEKTKIGIGGASAGGGLAAGLTLMTRDRGEIDLAFQLLIYPMIDDRNVTPSSYAIDDSRTWNRQKNTVAWKAYLGPAADSDTVSPYAAASRAKDLTGLPPTYIAVGELDLFLDENIEYAQRLLQAGVSTEFHVYPRATHGFDAMPTANVAQRFVEERHQAIIKALG